MKKFICTVCGYVHEGDAPPEECPICKAPANKFGEVTGELHWADEHRVGICDGIDPEIIEGLRANFNGECSIVETGVAVTTINIPHPVNKETIVSEIVLPSFERMNEVATIKVAA